MLRIIRALLHALMYAAMNKRWKNVEMLARYGANFSDIHEILADEIRLHAKEVEDGLTDRAKALMENGASLEVAKKINNIKKWAHIWGMKGNFTIEDENGRKTTFDLEGSRQQFMLQVLINYVSSFYKTNLSQNPILIDEKIGIQTSIANALFMSFSNIDYSNIIQKIQSENAFDPLVLLGGSIDHAISMVIYHNPTENRAELMICNRGEGGDFDLMSGMRIKRYCFPDKSYIDTVMVQNLIKKYRNMEEFYEMIAKIVKPLPQYDNFSQKEQRVGHCSWASTKGVIALLLIVATLKNPEKLSQALAANKEFTAWTRAEALRELLASNPDPSLVFLFIEKYFNKYTLFGPVWEGSSEKVKEIIEIIESSKSSSQDRKMAINMLISKLNQQMERVSKPGIISKPGIKDIGGQLENWLTKLSSQILEDDPEGAH